MKPVAFGQVSIVPQQYLKGKMAGIPFIWCHLYPHHHHPVIKLVDKYLFFFSDYMFEYLSLALITPIRIYSLLSMWIS